MISGCLTYTSLAYSCFSLQGICIFFFHCILNKDVRTNLKSVFGGKKVPAEESTATHTTLLTVSGVKSQHYISCSVYNSTFVSPLICPTYYLFYMVLLHLPPYTWQNSDHLISVQRTFNGNVYTEDGCLYRTPIGESTVSMENSVRSGKSHGSSYIAYTLR